MLKHTININNQKIEIQTDGKKLFWTQEREDGSRYANIIYQADYIDLRLGACGEDYVIIFAHHKDPISKNREDTKTLFVKFNIYKYTLKNIYYSTRARDYGSCITEDTGVEKTRIVPIIYDWNYITDDNGNLKEGEI